MSKNTWKGNYGILKKNKIKTKQTLGDKIETLSCIKIYNKILD